MAKKILNENEVLNAVRKGAILVESRVEGYVLNHPGYKMRKHTSSEVVASLLEAGKIETLSYGLVGWVFRYRWASEGGSHG